MLAGMNGNHVNDCHRHHNSTSHIKIYQGDYSEIYLVQIYISALMDNSVNTVTTCYCDYLFWKRVNTFVVTFVHMSTYILCSLQWFCKS